MFASLALLASLQLSSETFHLLEHPDARLSCSINAVLNCASVMRTPEAVVFGFPNSFLGLIAYAVFAAFALGGLAGTRYPRVVTRLVLAGALGGLVFAYWLFFQSVYGIQVLCPWCLLVTFSTTVMTGALLRVAVLERALGLPAAHQAFLGRLVSRDYDVAAVAGLVALLALVAYAKFGNALLGL